MSSYTKKPCNKNCCPSGPIVVGLTGGFGTGKTTVAQMFARLGAAVVSSDEIVWRLIRRRGKCFKPIVDHFGRDILTKGEINKRQLAGIVFADPSERAVLERIVHPAVIIELRQRMHRFRRGHKPGVMVIEIPLLFEVGFEQEVDVVVVVTARQKDQVERALNGRFGHRTEVVQRIKAQMALSKKVRRGDFVVDNSQDLARTRQQVRQVWQDLSQLLKPINGSHR